MIEQVSSIPLNTHLYIIDNSPHTEIGEHTDGSITRISTGRNLGYGKAHNLAIKRSLGLSKYHLISNTDIRFAGADIPTLLEKLESNDDVGMVAPRVRYPDGSLQHLCRIFPVPADLVAKRLFGWSRWGKARVHRYELKGWKYDRAMEIPFLSGCFMLARRAVLEKTNGFDERFFLYFEDLDLSRRMGMISKTMFEPAVEIIHDYRSKNSKNRKLLLYLIVSGVRYFCKWGWIVDDYRTRVNRRTLDGLSRDGSFAERAS